LTCACHGIDGWINQKALRLVTKSAALLGRRGSNNILQVLGGEFRAKKKQNRHVIGLGWAVWHIKLTPEFAFLLGDLGGDLDKGRHSLAERHRIPHQTSEVRGLDLGR
jgi:hypothetical protein